MVLKLPWAQKGMLWVFEKVLFQFFPKFWVTKLKPFSEKLKQSVPSYLNQNLVIGSFFKSGFEATFRKVHLKRLKRSFFSFCAFLSDEFQTIFWERETERLRQIKSKFGHRKLLKKWFCSYLDLKNEVSWCLKRPFSSFLQRFEWRSWNYFLGSWGGAF